MSNTNTRQLLTDIEQGTQEEVWEAAKKLVSVKGNDTVPSLVFLLKNGNRNETRCAAAYVLGFGRHSSARRELEAALINVREDTRLRGYAAEALGVIGDRASVEILLEQLKENDSGIRYWCIFALGQIGDPKALLSLKEVVESAANQTYDGHSLRTEALDAIAEIERRAKRGQSL